MSDNRQGRRPFQFMNGPWELSEPPAIVEDDPAGGDPHILCVLRRVYRPDEIYALCRLANDACEGALAAEIARLRAEVERKDAALGDAAKVISGVAGTVLGVAMSGDDHPDPDGALMGVVETCQDAFEAARAARSPAE